MKPSEVQFYARTASDALVSDLHQFVEQFVIAVDFQEPLPVTAETQLDSLPEWDSLAALGVIVMCDTDYGVTITGDDLKACVNVGDIFGRVLKKKGRLMAASRSTTSDSAASRAAFRRRSSGISIARTRRSPSVNAWSATSGS